MPRYKYSDYTITEAVRSSTSMYGVLRYLGMKITGGQHYHISNRVRKLRLDTSHFVSNKDTNRGKTFGPKKSAAELLIYNESDRRTGGKYLTRALKEKGVVYECAACLCDGMWYDRPITLHVDHIDGNWKNNHIDNLRFLCPNCHQQTSTFGSKNIGV